MKVLIVAFLTVAVVKFVLNLSKYLSCKRYLKKYLRWLARPTWDLAESRSQVIRLFEDAGVTDNYIPVAEPLGLMQVATMQVSTFANFPHRREDFAAATLTMFREAIGVYRWRAFSVFNPLYWIEFTINLPKEILSYLGVSPESAVVKLFQIVCWGVGTIVAMLYAFFRPEIEGLVRQWVSGHIP